MLLAPIIVLSLTTQQPNHPAPPDQPAATVTVAPFGRTPDWKGVHAYPLENASGMQVRATTYRAILQAIRVPDRSGHLADVTLGYDSLREYLTASPYFGAVVGRYANRIARGRFTLEGRTYRLATNNGPNHRHGGLKGYDKVVWLARSFQRDDISAVRFEHTSPPGDEGYPVLSRNGAGCFTASMCWTRKRAGPSTSSLRSPEYSFTQGTFSTGASPGCLVTSTAIAQD